MKRRPHPGSGDNLRQPFRKGKRARKTIISRKGASASVCVYLSRRLTPPGPSTKKYPRKNFPSRDCRGPPHRTHVISWSFDAGPFNPDDFVPSRTGGAVECGLGFGAVENTTGRQKNHAKQATRVRPESEPEAVGPHATRSWEYAPEIAPHHGTAGETDNQRARLHGPPFRSRWQHDRCTSADRTAVLIAAGLG